nr:uncharacterized protein LOC110361174 [Columba livia]
MNRRFSALQQDKEPGEGPGCAGSSPGHLAQRGAWRRTGDAVDGRAFPAAPFGSGRRGLARPGPSGTAGTVPTRPREFPAWSRAGQRSPGLSEAALGLARRGTSRPQGLRGLLPRRFPAGGDEDGGGRDSLLLPKNSLARLSTTHRLVESPCSGSSPGCQRPGPSRGHGAGAASRRLCPGCTDVAPTPAGGAERGLGLFCSRPCPSGLTPTRPRWDAGALWLPRPRSPFGLFLLGAGCVFCRVYLPQNSHGASVRMHAVNCLKSFLQATLITRLHPRAWSGCSQSKLTCGKAALTWRPICEGREAQQT